MNYTLRDPNGNVLLAVESSPVVTEADMTADLDKVAKACESAFDEVTKYQDAVAVMSSEGFGDQVKIVAEKVKNKLIEWFKKIIDFFKRIGLFIGSIINKTIGKIFVRPAKLTEPEKQFLLEYKPSESVSGESATMSVEGIDDNAHSHLREQTALAAGDKDKRNYMNDPSVNTVRDAKLTAAGNILYDELRKILADSANKDPNDPKSAKYGFYACYISGNMRYITDYYEQLQKALIKSKECTEMLNNLDIASGNAELEGFYPPVPPKISNTIGRCNLQLTNGNLVNFYLNCDTFKSKLDDWIHPMANEVLKELKDNNNCFETILKSVENSNEIPNNYKNMCAEVINPIVEINKQCLEFYSAYSYAVVSSNKFISRLNAALKGSVVN